MSVRTQINSATNIKVMPVERLEKYDKDGHFWTQDIVIETDNGDHTFTAFFNAAVNKRLEEERANDATRA